MRGDWNIVKVLITQCIILYGILNTVFLYWVVVSYVNRWIARFCELLVSIFYSFREIFLKVVLFNRCRIANLFTLPLTSTFFFQLCFIKFYIGKHANIFFFNFSHFIFVAKFSRRHRGFPTYFLLPAPSIAFPLLTAPARVEHLLQLVNLYGHIIINPKFVVYIRIFDVVHFLGLDKCIITHTYHYSIFMP